MTRSFRLTRRAEESLIEIAKWTIETFGQRQAGIYETELIARCEAIAKAEVFSRDCSILAAGVRGLRFTQAGQHFLVFLDRPDEVIVVDILHSRSDLPRHVETLIMASGEEIDSD